MNHTIIITAVAALAALTLNSCATTEATSTTPAPQTAGASQERRGVERYPFDTCIALAQGDNIPFSLRPLVTEALASNHQLQSDFETFRGAAAVPDQAGALSNPELTYSSERPTISGQRSSQQQRSLVLPPPLGSSRSRPVLSCSRPGCGHRWDSSSTGPTSLP